MKRSRYTVCHDLGNEEYVLFNTATGRLAVCDVTTAEALEAGEGPDESLAVLYDAGFMVDDGRDELAEQDALFSAFRHDRSRLWLALAPTYACNCRCAYCYEQDKLTAKSIMSAEVEEAILDFAQGQWERDHYTSLFVEWYGGDPQLCLDLVERIATRLMSFCDEHDIAYDSMMLSNATLIGAEQAELLARSRVGSLLITIDGPEELHNQRRSAVGIKNPYQRIKEAIVALQGCGIRVDGMMNADKVNMEHLHELREEFAQLGVSISCAKLNDYPHAYNKPGETRFCAPHIQLYNHEEFAHAGYEAAKAEGFTAQGLGALLAPSDHFCSGQSEAAYVIDAFGDVYKCDGWMGDRSRALFNLLDGSDPVRDNVAFDPFDHEKCRACELLPLCWGNCSWERERCDWPCHPLVHTMGDYLTSYRACFDKGFEPPLQVLA